MCTHEYNIMMWYLLQFVKTSSPKERIRVTFNPVAAPNHPQVEIDCEPGHPFMVDKKGMHNKTFRLLPYLLLIISLHDDEEEQHNMTSHFGLFASQSTFSLNYFEIRLN